MRPLPAKCSPADEDGATFEENAVVKAEYYGKFVDGWLLRNSPAQRSLARRKPSELLDARRAEPALCWLFADDSGLEVDCAGGAPGVHSARYAGPEATDRDNNALLLERLKGAANRTARFVCVIALVNQGKLVQTFRGAVEGRILHDARGSGGFGYDPLFYYEPFGCTFGEAPIDRKMTVSHRAQALEAMFTFLRNSAST